MKTKLIIFLIVALILVNVCVVKATTWTPGMSAGLNAYWNFDEATGSNVVDVFSGTRNGTIINITYNVTRASGASCKLSGCVRTDGQGAVSSPLAGYVNISNSSGLLFTNRSWSITFWAKDDDASLSARQIITTTSSSTLVEDPVFEAYTPDIGGGVTKMQLRFTAGGQDFYIRNPQPLSTQQGTWQFYVITYSGNKSYTGVTYYQNGSKITTEHYVDGTLTNASLIKLAFGSAYGYYGFTGYIDDIGMWNRTLNDSEISDMWNSGAGLTYTSGTADTVYPVFSNLGFNVTNNTEYNPNLQIRFNSTIVNTNGTATFTINGTTYTASNSSSEFYVTVSNLSAGTYTYTWTSYGNGTSNNINTTTGSYTIAKNSTLVLGLTATTPITYGTATNFAGSGCPTGVTCSLNITNGIFGVPSVSANYSLVGNTNYTDKGAVFTVTINQATSAVKTYLNNAQSNITITAGTSIWLNGTRQTGEGNIKLYSNLLGQFGSNVLCYQESANVSNQSGIDGNCGLNYNGNYSVGGAVFGNFSSIIDGNYNTGSSNSAGSELAFYKKPSSYNNTVSSVIWRVKDQSGTYNISLPTSCTNYSDYIHLEAGSRDSFPTGNTYYCYNSDSTTILLLNNSVSDGTIYEEGVYWNVSSSFVNLINSGTSSISNLTTFNTFGIYNITTIYESTQNYSQSSETWFVNVVLPPTAQEGTTNSGGTYTPFTNNTYINNTTTNFTANVTSNASEISNITITIVNVTNNATINQTTTNLSGQGLFSYLWGLPISLIDGIYNFFVETFDGIGNYVSTTMSYFVVDTTPPSITSQDYTVIFPNNDSYVYILNATITDANLNTTLINFNGTNQTTYNVGNSYRYNFTKVLPYVPYSSNYYWWAKDNVNHTTQKNNTFSITCPTNYKTFNNSYCVETLNFTSSGNITRYLLVSSTATTLRNVTINTSGIGGNLSNASLYLGSTNVWNYSGNYNGTNMTNDFSATVNSYLSTCTYVGGYCSVPFTFHSDSSGLLRYLDFEYLFPGFNENSRTFNPQTLSGANENFTINLTYDNSIYNAITTYLVYNNTNYSSIASGTGSTVLFTNNINVPVVSSQTNETFYWLIALSNANGTTYYNSTTSTQQVDIVSIDNCTLNNDTILNFTMLDEETLAEINGTIEISATITAPGNSNVIGTYNGTINYVIGNNNTVCTSPINSTYLLAYTIRHYGNASYFKKFRTVQAMTVTNNTATQHINLYNLLIASGYSFKVILSGTIPGYSNSDLLIELEKKYVAQDRFNLVESTVTSSDGTTALHIIPQTDIYNFVLSSNGVILTKFNNYQLVCQNPATLQCSVTLNLGGELVQTPDYSNYGNISVDYSVNNASDTLTTNFNSIDGLTHNITQVVYQDIGKGRVTICNLTTVGSSGALVCNIPTSYQNSTLFSQVFSDGSLVRSKALTLGEPITNIDMYGVDIIIELIMYSSLVLLFISNPITIVLGAIIGVVMSISLITISSGSFGSIILSAIFFALAGGIIIWQISRKI